MVNFHQATVNFHMNRKDYPLFYPLQYPAIVFGVNSFPGLISGIVEATRKKCGRFDN